MAQTAEKSKTVFEGWELVPIAGNVGVEVRHADLRQPLTPRECEHLHELIAFNGVVIFPCQSLDNDAHLELAKQFGRPKLPPDYLPSLAEHGYPEISVTSTENGVAYTSDR